MNRFLRLFGYKIVYVSEFGTHSQRYTRMDGFHNRPLHRGMDIAPPWAKRKIEKMGGGKS